MIWLTTQPERRITSGFSRAGPRSAWADAERGSMRRVLIINGRCGPVGGTSGARLRLEDGQTRKSHFSQAGGSTRRSLAEPGSCVGGSGGVGFGDDSFAVADGNRLAGECLELAGEVAGPSVAVDASLEVVGAKVAEPGGGVR